MRGDTSVMYTASGGPLRFSGPTVTTSAYLPMSPGASGSIVVSPGCRSESIRPGGTSLIPKGEGPEGLVLKSSTLQGRSWHDHHWVRVADIGRCWKRD